MKYLMRFLSIVILISLFISACKSSTENDNADPNLQFIASYPLQIGQPSGIAINKDNTAYWIVDGENDKICKTDLKGNILEILHYKGDDIEGICFDSATSTLWIVEEELRQVVQLDLAGKELARYQTNIAGSKNKGLEGISIDEQQNIYVLNEKYPKAIFALGKDFNFTKEYDFPGVEDLSDLFYSPASKYFFILSDESKGLYIWGPKEGLVSQYRLPFTKCEGITVNPASNKIVIVNDSLNTLFEYELKNSNVPLK